MEKNFSFCFESFIFCQNEANFLRAAILTCVMSAIVHNSEKNKLLPEALRYLLLSHTGPRLSLFTL